MAHFKQYLWCKVICLILIVSFICLDIAWAYPADGAPGSYNLSLWSVLNQPAGSEGVKRLELAESIYGIGQFLFGLSADQVRLKPKWLREALGKTADRFMADVDIDHVTLARFTDGGNKLEAIPDEELNDKNVPRNAIILIPYKTGSHRRVVLVALRDNIASSYIIGYPLDGPVPSACTARFVDEDYIERQYGLSFNQDQTSALIASVSETSLSESVATPVTSDASPTTDDQANKKAIADNGSRWPLLSVNPLILWLIPVVAVYFLWRYRAVVAKMFSIKIPIEKLIPRDVVDTHGPAELYEKREFSHLIKLGDKAVMFLCQHWKENIDDKERAIILELIGRVETEKAIEFLINVLTGDEKMSRAAQDTLVMVGKPALPFLRKHEGESRIVFGTIIRIASGESVHMRTNAGSILSLTAVMFLAGTSFVSAADSFATAMAGSASLVSGMSDNLIISLGVVSLALVAGVVISRYIYLRIRQPLAWLGKGLRSNKQKVVKARAQALYGMGEPGRQILVKALTSYPANGLVIAETLKTLGWKPANDNEKISYAIAMRRWDVLEKGMEKAKTGLRRAMIAMLQDAEQKEGGEEDYYRKITELIQNTEIAISFDDGVSSLPFAQPTGQNAPAQEATPVVPSAEGESWRIGPPIELDDILGEEPPSPDAVKQKAPPAPKKAGPRITGKGKIAGMLISGGLITALLGSTNVSAADTIVSSADSVLSVSDKIILMAIGIAFVVLARIIFFSVSKRIMEKRYLDHLMKGEEPRFENGEDPWRERPRSHLVAARVIDMMVDSEELIPELIIGLGGRGRVRRLSAQNHLIDIGKSHRGAVIKALETAMLESGNASRRVAAAGTLKRLNYGSQNPVIDARYRALLARPSRVKKMWRWFIMRYGILRKSLDDIDIVAYAPTLQDAARILIQRKIKRQGYALARPVMRSVIDDAAQMMRRLGDFAVRYSPETIKILPPSEKVDTTAEAHTGPWHGLAIVERRPPESIPAETPVRAEKPPAPEERAREAALLKQIFAIVDGRTNNLRSEVTRIANEVIAEHAEFIMPQSGPFKRTLMSEEMTTAEMIFRLHDLLGYVKEKGITHDELSVLEDGLKRLEPNGIFGSVIKMAISARNEDQKAILYFQEDWNAALGRQGYRNDVLQILEQEIKTIPAALRKMGLDKYVEVKFVTAQELSALAGIKGKFVTIIGARDTIDPLAERFMRDEETPFFAAIDTAKLVKEYEESRADPAKVLDINIMEMVCLALELAAGKAPGPKIPLIDSYDPQKRYVRFLPSATPVNYSEIRQLHDAKHILEEAA